MSQQSTLRNKRVFIVDDEALITMSLEDMLDSLGCIVAGSAASLDQALAAARTVQADAAVLDVNLGRERSDEVARILNERGVPVIYATGYGADGAPNGWPSARILPKPFVIADLEKALNSAIGS